MNKIIVKNLNTQYSKIMVEKECSICNGNCLRDINNNIDDINNWCRKCKGTGRIIKKHIVSNNGWLPLKYWVDKFKKEIK